ncbi:MAG: thioredoxin family protein [Anaerolineae bacterium]|nr:thioredoxin family protein [Anaerolineae bacterium]
MTTPLHDYAGSGEALYAIYEAYQPEAALLAVIARRLPEAHVVIAMRHGCRDCARNLPAMARIAEHLPGWNWEIFEDSDSTRKAALGVLRVPAFIIYDADGVERGRIIENPLSGSLEQDLLMIVTGVSQASASTALPTSG